MKMPFKLSPKAEELLAKIEAREARAKAGQADPVQTVPPEEPKRSVGWGPNPLDIFAKVGLGK
jgi:hypothetical protein